MIRLGCESTILLSRQPKTNWLITIIGIYILLPVTTSSVIVSSMLNRILLTTNRRGSNQKLSILPMRTNFDTKNPPDAINPHSIGQLPELASKFEK